MMALDYPRNRVDNLRFRAFLLAQCEKDPLFCAEVKSLCRLNPIFWIDNFCWTKDPRKPDAIIPFICYDIQQEAAIEIKKAITDGYDLLIEKSRDMGLSWLVLYIFQHEFQFEKGADFRVGSRKEDFVDKLGVIDTLLEKVRWNLARQPLFLLPRGFKEQREFEDNTTYMRLLNEDGNNSIVGESANEHFGSAGRSKAALLDEFAKWPRGIDASAWGSLADVTRCRIAVSSAKGAANKFARLARGREEKIKILTYHWTLHPEKSKGAYYISNGVKIDINMSNYKTAFTIWKETFAREARKVRSPWYDIEDVRRTESDLAEDVDINYHGSGSMFFSARALAKQKIWTSFKRALPSDPIPYGKYIRGILLEVDNTIKFRETEDGWLYLTELPKEGYQYVVPGDSAEGLIKSDESFGIIRCKITENVIGMFHGQVAPEDFAKQIQLAAWFFNEGDGAPENNNHGYTTAKEIEALPHVKLYYTLKDEVDEQGQKVKTKKRGFTTDNRSRPHMLNHMAHQIEKGALDLRFEILINQCETFVRNGNKGGRPEADGEFKDDGVLACAIGGEVIRQQPYTPKKKSIDFRKAEVVDKRAAVKNAGFGF